MVGTYVSRIVAFLGAMALAALGCSGCASYAEGNSASVSANATTQCIAFEQPSAEAWDECETVARFNATLQGHESAKAFYHAAAWNYQQRNYAAAVRLAQESFDRLPTGHSLLTTPPNDRRYRNRRNAEAWVAASNQFQFDRVILLARAYSELAKLGGDLTARSSEDRVCRNRDDCISEALRLLSDGGGQNAVLDPYRRTPTTQQSSQYNTYYLLSGELNELRGTRSSRRAAIEDYRRVMQGGLGDADETRARAKIEAIAIALGEDATREGSTPRDWAQAIAYFDDALVARPDSLRALELKGDTALRLAQSEEDGGRLYFDTAREAYAQLSGAASLTPTDRARASFKRGRTASAWADMLEELPSPSVREREQARNLREDAVLHFEAAVATDDRTDYRDRLSEAYVRNQNFEKADAAYLRSVADILGQAGWSVPTDYDQPGSPDASAFEAQVGNLDYAQRRAIADAIVRLYDLRKAAEETGTSTLPAEPSQLDILRAVEIADDTRDAYQLDLAAYYLGRGNPRDIEAATTRLDEVIARTPAAAGSAARAERARALYLRSRAELAKAAGRDSGRAVVWAEEAVQLDGSKPDYRTQACVADIVDGGKFRSETQPPSWCSGMTGPEGQLLQGMFYLRQAQHERRNAGRIWLRAQQVFNLGLDALEEAEDDGDPVFPGFDIQPHRANQASLSTLLNYGRARAITCDGTSFETGLSPGQINRAARFFQDYQVDRCTR